MKPFESLTTRGRARRLRGIALNALHAYDLDVERVRLINNVSNCTFRVDTADGSSYALRINLPGLRSAAEIRSELTWQEAICRETDIPAPLPVRTRSGDLVVEAEAPGVPELRLCNLVTWVRGTTLRRWAAPRYFRKLGRLSAELHAHGASFEPPEDFSLPRLDTDLPDTMPDLLRSGERPAEINTESFALVQQVRDALAAELERLYTPDSRLQVIHGDLHWWNVLVYRSRLHPIDFEDCAWAFPVQDIAITFYYLLRHPDYEALTTAFRAGYEEYRPWPEEYEGQVDLFIGQRALDLINLLLNSTYVEDRELIPHFVENLSRYYWPLFECAVALRQVAAG